MDNLKQLGRQILALWKQLGLNQRITVVMASAALLVGLGSLAFWSSRVDYALLYRKLDDAEAAKVVAVLNETKVPYRFSQNGGAIYVPSDKVHAVRMQLAAKGIPRGEGVGFEIFDKPNFGISDFVQRANYLRALQGELARTIGQLDEVESARVMVVLPDNRLLVDHQKHPTASVFVRTKGSTALQPTSVNSIRFLVANAVEGLAANHVTVVDNKGNVLSENTETDSLGSLSTTQFAARRNVEQYLAKKAEGMLEKVLGPGQAVVRVSADINFDTISRVEEKFDPEGQVVRSATINDEDVSSTTVTSGATPGVAGGNSGETNLSASPVNNSRTRKKVTNNQYEINRTTSNILEAAGGLRRVSAAVFIAAKIEGAGPTSKVAPRTSEELEKLKRIVQSALGLQSDAGSTRKDEITLEEMPFSDQFTTDVTQQLVTEEKTRFWWSTAEKSIYPLLAVGILYFLFRLLKKTPVETLSVGSASHPAADGQAKNGWSDWDQGTDSSVVTPEVLNRLIRENPANMTDALRTWMSRGGQPK